MRVEIMPKISERGLIAILALAVCTTLIMSGKDTVIGWALLSVVAGYFGIEVAPGVITKIRKKGD